MSIHSSFILTPVSDILEDSIKSTRGITDGIDIYPLCDYIFQTLFVKMTGAQEQKFKCICWDFATVDYETRRNIFFSWNLGECSRLEDKEAVLTEMINAIKRLEPSFDASSAFSAQDIFNETKQIISDFYRKSHLKGFLERNYNEYEYIISQLPHDCISYGQSKKKKMFFGKCDNCRHQGDATKPLTCVKKYGFREIYDKLYKHRNRCAHNLTSYQQNLPSFKTLCDGQYIFENYFLRFFILILIDKIIVAIYRCFFDKLDN